MANTILSFCSDRKINYKFYQKTLLAPCLKFGEAYAWPNVMMRCDRVEEHDVLSNALPGSAIDITGCHRYILSRKTPQGGFSFYRYGPWSVEEPNAADTWAAITALELLEQPIPRCDQLITWLQQQQYDNGGYASLVIAEAVLFSLRQLNAEPMQDTRAYLLRHCQNRHITDRSAIDWPGWLANTDRCLRLMANHDLPLLSVQETVQPVLGHLHDTSGGYAHPGPSVIRTWYALDILRHLQLPLEPETLDFVRRCENPALGFTLAPGTTATSLETQLAGLRTLQLFAAKPLYPDAIYLFTTHCQSARGGFARVPGALPGLRDTYRALAILSLLSDEGIR